MAVFLDPAWTFSKRAEISQAANSSGEHLIAQCMPKTDSVESLLLLGRLAPAPGTPNVREVLPVKSETVDSEFTLTTSAHQLDERVYALFLLRRGKNGVWIVWDGKPSAASSAIEALSSALRNAASTSR
ncbi:MAG: hypothetical protein H7255_15950 [Ramlibacter sp.]|nr:hypothetical protein [Ramlibacter sp.]